MNEVEPHQPTRAELITVLFEIAAALMAIVAIVGWQWAGSERADLAQWIMAGAAVATVFAAIGAAVFAASAFRLESDRETRFQETLRRHQAERVAAWVQVIEKVTTNRVRYRAILVRNASDLPVTKVELDIWYGGSNVATHEIVIVPPAPDPLEVQFGPTLSRAVARAKNAFEAEHGKDAEKPAITVDIGFTDAAGQRWFREATGLLVED